MCRRPVVVALTVTALLIGGSPLASANASVPSAAPAITCDGLEATIVGTNEDDEIRGTEGPDVIVGLRGKDKILGLGGDDVICGGTRPDKLNGGEGDDRLFGEEDHAWVGDTLVGGPGNDYLDGGLVQGENRAMYAKASSPIEVDGSTGTVTGESIGTDTLVSIIIVVGSRFADRYVGGPVRTCSTEAAGTT